MGKKRKQTDDANEDYDSAPSLPPSQIQKISHHKHRVLNQEKRLIVILEGAQLETVKNGNKFELLNSDDHVNMLKKNGRDAGSCRPDITHACLLALLDSGLNRKGLLQVYIHTTNNVLIEVNPQTRIPRTFKRFAGLMVQLLHKFYVSAKNGPKLLKVIKNPITDHLPVGIKKIATSYSSKRVIEDCEELIPVEEEPLAMIIGAFARGNLDVDYAEETVCIRDLPYSASSVCERLCISFERKWCPLNVNQ